MGEEVGRGRALERLRGGPADGGNGRGRSEERPGRRGNGGGDWSNRESGQWRGRGARRPGRRVPGRPVSGGSRVGTEVGPVNGGFRVAAEAGRGARALLTGARGRRGARAGLGRASRGQRRLKLAAPCPGLQPRKWRAQGTAAAADTGHPAAQAPLTRKSSGPGGGLGLATSRPAPRSPGRWGGERASTAPRQVG